MNQQLLSIAHSYREACELLRSGFVKQVRLDWNIGTDEFFRIASDWCDAGAKIKKRREQLYYFTERIPYSPPAVTHLS